MKLFDVLFIILCGIWLGIMTYLFLLVISLFAGVL